jgi:hypothetical protein
MVRTTLQEVNPSPVANAVNAAMSAMMMALMIFCFVIVVVNLISWCKGIIKTRAHQESELADYRKPELF